MLTSFLRKGVTFGFQPQKLEKAGEAVSVCLGRDRGVRRFNPTEADVHKKQDKKGAMDPMSFRNLREP